MGTAHRNLAFMAEARRNKLPDSFDRVMPVLRAMVAALIESEQVCINVCNDAHEAEARQVLRGLPMERISFHMIPDKRAMVPGSRAHFFDAR